MLKLSYVITLLSGLGLFNSCAVNFVNLPNEEIILSYLQKKDSAYGSYLAGRVAHIRQDYNNASYYYAKSIERGLKNKDLLGKTYIILASLGWWLSTIVKLDDLYVKVEEYNTYLTYFGLAIAIFCILFIIRNIYKHKK